LATASEVLSYEQSRAELDELVMLECIRRRDLYNTVRHLPTDSPEDKEFKNGFLIHDLLPLWASDPLRWIRDCAWSPDPKQRFGIAPEGIAPRGMVPVIPFAIQAEFIRKLAAAMEMREPPDFAFLKPRQVFFTGFALYAMLHGWLFKPQRSFLLGTYRTDLIDRGGKGNREPDTMFGRLRLYLDAFLWNFRKPSPSGIDSVLKFGQQDRPHPNAGKGRMLKQWLANPTGLSESEDSSFKLVRPRRWDILGIDMFPDAAANWFVGQLPGDDFGRGISALAVFGDEAGQINKAIGPQADRRAWNACNETCRFRIWGGTVPDGGGVDTKLYELCERLESDDETLTRIDIEWTDIPPYFAGAWWNCPSCRHRNPTNKPPKVKGYLARCGECKKITDVDIMHFSSHWFERVKKKMGNDPVGLAREYLRQWSGAMTGQAFPGFKAENQVAERSPTYQWRTVMGYDPGHSEENPHAWGLVRFDDQTQTPRLIRWHMAANWSTQKWIPFMKCWHPSMLPRMKVLYGSPSEVGMPFSAFEYSREELEILERISEFAHETKDWYGDSYGDNKESGRTSAYKIMAHYEVRMRFDRQQDRADQVRKAQNVWMPRLEIEDECAKYTPVRPGGYYPNIVECVQTAQMRSSEGQTDVKYDISASKPTRYVKHPMDMLIYIFRALPDVAHAVSDLGGNFSVEANRKPVIINRGDAWAGL